MIQISNEVSQKFKNMALLCALMVVAIHCVNGQSMQNSFIRTAVYDGFCRMAVPFFFFASGFFLAGHMREGEGWYGCEVLKRVKSLLLPYCIWTLLFVGLHFIATGAIERDMGFYLKAFGLNPLHHPLLAQLWYIRALFVLVLLSFLLHRLIVYTYRLLGTGWVIVVATFFIYLWLGRWEGLDGERTYFFRKFFAVQGLFYFTLGISARLGTIKLFLSRHKAWMLFALGVVLMLIKIQLHRAWFIHFHIFGTLAVVCLVVGGINLISSARIPQTVVSCAFPIYILHYFFASALMKVWADFPVAIYPVCVVGVFGVSLGCAIVLQRVVPCLGTVLWGGGGRRCPSLK